MSIRYGDPGDDVPLADQIRWELIADYVTGRAPPDVRARVEARRDAEPAFRADLAAAVMAWDRTIGALTAPVTPADTERAWQRLARELVDPPLVIPRRSTPIRRHRARRPRWVTAALAASIVAIIALGVTYAVDRYDTIAASAMTMREIVAERGQRVAITLSDGGRVVLAPGSTLQAPERFTGDVRSVTLSGRAYFEVAHDSTRPFIVHTEGVAVRVLGTEFDLRAYAGSGSSEVVVRSGRVAITPTARAATPTILDTGDRGTVDEGGTVRLESGVDVDAFLSWTTGRLVFERAPLHDVIAELERWHDIEITVDSSLSDRRITAAFDREPLDTVIETVATLVNAQVRRDGRNVTLSTFTGQR